MLGLAIALLLPAFLGIPTFWLLWQRAHPAARVGYGYLTGMLFIAFFLWVWGQVFSLPYRFYMLVVPIGFISLSFWLIAAKYVDKTVERTFSGEKGWARWLWWGLLALLVFRFGSTFVEVILRPLFPWDAWMNWAPKAKVWFFLQEWVPFVQLKDWPTESLISGSYAIGNVEATDYPPFVPLIQLWMAMGLNEWRDNLINLPWWTGGVAFGLAFYGQLRTVGVTPIVAMIVVYLLCSMPYLNTHIALAGYAELWMATFYCAGAMALINWNLTGARGQLLLLVMMGVACVFIKQPGFIWGLTLMAGLLMGLLTHRMRYLLLVLSIVLVIFLFIVGGVNLRLPGDYDLVFSSHLVRIPGIADHVITYHPVSEHFIVNALIRDNWHLIGWLALVLAFNAVPKALVNPQLLPGLTVITLGVLFIGVVFFFTKHYQSAIDSTTINRAIFHLLPSLLYFLVIALWYKFPKFGVQARRNLSSR